VPVGGLLGERRRAMVEAPWNDDQVMSLNAYQACEWHHPFTCGERESDGTHHVLVATREGWYCPRCMARNRLYVQTWCHDFMADWSWKNGP
jgi:hypothetical protein